MAAKSRKCLKGFVHEWETTMMHRTHIIKTCWRCHGTKWQERRGVDAEVESFRNAPTNTAHFARV